jgi:hypothetical protein
MTVVCLLALCMALAFGQSGSQVLAPNVTLSWTISDSNITINAKFTSHFGWVGIGWHAASNSPDNQGMANANFAIAQFNSRGNLTAVGDFVSSTHDGGFTEPVSQPSSSLSSSSGFADPVAAVTTFSFTRPLVSSVPGDISFTNGLMEVIWARAQKNQTTLAYHGKGNADSFHLNFFA